MCRLQSALSTFVRAVMKLVVFLVEPHRKQFPKDFLSLLLIGLILYTFFI